MLRRWGCNGSTAAAAAPVRAGRGELSHGFRSSLGVLRRQADRKLEAMASAAAKSTAGKGPPRLPAAIANATLEELQKMFVDTLVKMRKKDRRIEELAAAATAAAVPGSVPSDGDAAEPAMTAALQQQASRWPLWTARLHSSEPRDGFRSLSHIPYSQPQLCFGIGGIDAENFG